MNENNHDQRPPINTVTTTPEERPVDFMSLDLITPEHPEFLKLQQRMIEQNGCPDIEDGPNGFLEGRMKKIAI